MFGKAYIEPSAGRQLKMRTKVEIQTYETPFTLFKVLVTS